MRSGAQEHARRVGQWREGGGGGGAGRRGVREEGRDESEEVTFQRRMESCKKIDGVTKIMIFSTTVLEGRVLKNVLR